MISFLSAGNQDTLMDSDDPDRSEPAAATTHTMRPDTRSVGQTHTHTHTINGCRRW